MAPTARRILCLPLLALLGPGLALGCGNGKAAGFFQFQGTITKTKMNADGSVTTETKQYDDWDEQLVAAAPTSIVNPKVVLHLDLVVKGLEDSVKVVGSCGKMLVELVRELGTLREG